MDGAIAGTAAPTNQLLHRLQIVARSESASALLSVGIVAALAASCLWWRTDFFLRDDYATYFLPLMREIGRLVAAGHFPLVTDRLWVGGAIVPEYQLGVFNPFSMAMTLTAASIDDFRIAATFFSIAHLAVFSAGTYALLRTLHCPRLVAILGAVIAPTSEWIFYWGATDWITFLTSIAWGPWALAASARAARDAKWIPLTALAVAMVITAGCAFANFALIVVSACGAVAAMTYGRRGLLALIRVGTGVLLGALLAAPAVLPMIPFSAISGRAGNDVLFQGTLGALAGAGVPFMVAKWKAFSGSTAVAVYPMLCVAWFVIATLATAPWRRLWSLPAVRVAVLCALAFAIGSLTPGLWQFRWMFRLLPYYQFALVVLTALALSSGAMRRLAPTLLTGLAPLGIAAALVPAFAPIYAGAGVAIAVLLTIAVRRPAVRVPVLIAGHAGFFILVAFAFSGQHKRFPNEWRPPVSAPSAAVSSLTRYSVFPFPGDKANSGSFWDTYHAGNTSLDLPGAAITGYSPFFLRPNQRLFCVMHLGASECQDIIARISQPLTDGHSALDLARVDEVLVQQPIQAATFAHLHPDWRRSVLPDGGARFDRAAPFRWPAPLGAATEDTKIRVISEEPSRIRMQVRTTQGGQLTMARAWYPGWSATLDGRSVPVSSIHGVFTAVNLPPDSDGLLELDYWPAGLSQGLWCAGLAALGLLAMVARRRIVTERPQEPRQYTSPENRPSGGEPNR